MNTDSKASRQLQAAPAERRLPRGLATPLPASGRRQRKRDQVRERIVAAALALFAERGFSETTTEQITEAADVGQGTFFNYFPTKQHILVELSGMQLSQVRRARQRAEASRGPIQTALHGLMQQLGREPAQSQALARSLMTAFAAGETVRALISATLAEARAELAAILELGQRRGEIRRDRSSAELAMGFQRAMAGTMTLWVLQSKNGLHGWIDKAFRDFWSSAQRRRSGS